MDISFWWCIPVPPTGSVQLPQPTTGPSGRARARGQGRRSGSCGRDVVLLYYYITIFTMFYYHYHYVSFFDVLTPIVLVISVFFLDFQLGERMISGLCDACTKEACGGCHMREHVKDDPSRQHLFFHVHRHVPRDASPCQFLNFSTAFFSKPCWWRNDTENATNLQ